MADVANRSTLRLVHYGRKSAKPYEVTIWFVAEGDHVYLATMNATRQWVRNVAKTPRVKLKVGEVELEGEVERLADDEERVRAYQLFRDKYWVMWVMDVVAGLLGRSPRTTGRVDAGRGAFFRVDL
jgi:deazaflavin-dependent oxidoreductase (nitroreductase family)